MSDNAGDQSDTDALVGNGASHRGTSTWLPLLFSILRSLPSTLAFACVSVAFNIIVWPGVTGLALTSSKERAAGPTHAPEKLELPLLQVAT